MINFPWLFCILGMIYSVHSVRNSPLRDEAFIVSSQVVGYRIPSPQDQGVINPGADIVIEVTPSLFQRLKAEKERNADTPLMDSAVTTAQDLFLNGDSIIQSYGSVSFCPKILGNFH